MNKKFWMVIFFIFKKLCLFSSCFINSVFKSISSTQTIIKSFQSGWLAMLTCISFFFTEFIFLVNFKESLKVSIGDMQVYLLEICKVSLLHFWWFLHLLYFIEYPKQRNPNNTYIIIIIMSLLILLLNCEIDSIVCEIAYSVFNVGNLR